MTALPPVDYQPNEGHTCPNCGMWVPDNQIHSCLNKYQLFSSPYNTVLERIAVALEKIAESLSKS